MGHFFSVFFILLTKSMRNPNAQLAHFSKWRQIVERDVLRSDTKSRVPLRGLHSTSYLKASPATSDDRPGLGSYANDLSAKRNFGNKFWTWQSVMPP